MNFEFKIDMETRSYLWRELSSKEAIRFQLMKDLNHPSESWKWLMLQGLFLDEETPIDLDFLDKEMTANEYFNLQNLLAENIMAITIEDGKFAVKDGYEDLLSEEPPEIAPISLRAGTVALLQDGLVSKDYKALEKLIKKIYGVNPEDLNFWECGALLNHLSNQLQGNSDRPKVSRYIPPAVKK